MVALTERVQRRLTVEKVEIASDTTAIRCLDHGPTLVGNGASDHLQSRRWNSRSRYLRSHQETIGMARKRNENS